MPTLVTVVPFSKKANETDREKTKVVIPATVDGASGNFILDLGDPGLSLNRTFLQPNKTNGGIDSITAANRVPESGDDGAVTVTLRIGTLVVATRQHPLRAALDHKFGNYSWVFGPRLGNIGVTVLEPFETIIDYTKQRIVLIRLDSLGHRFAQVPAYTPAWSAPLLDLRGHNFRWGVEVQVGGIVDSLLFDTGSDVTLTLNSASRARLATHLANNTVDSLTLSGRAFKALPYRDVDLPFNLAGYYFLRQFGVVGFNHRTHEFILYR